MRHQFGIAASTTDSTLGIDDDVLPLDQPSLDKRSQRQDGGGGITTGIRHEFRPRQQWAEQFRQPIGNLAKPLLIAVFHAIPLEVGRCIVEPVVGTEIDHGGSRVEQARHDRR